MGQIRKLKSEELLGGVDNTDVYPITSTDAVFNSEGSNVTDLLKGKADVHHKHTKEELEGIIIDLDTSSCVHLEGEEDIKDIKNFEKGLSSNDDITLEVEDSKIKASINKGRAMYTITLIEEQFKDVLEGAGVNIEYMESLESDSEKYKYFIDTVQDSSLSDYQKKRLVNFVSGIITDNIVASNYNSYVSFNSKDTSDIIVGSYNHDGVKLEKELNTEMSNLGISQSDYTFWNPIEDGDYLIFNFYKKQNKQAKGFVTYLTVYTSVYPKASYIGGGDDDKTPAAKAAITPNSIITRPIFVANNGKIYALNLSFAMKDFQSDITQYAPKGMSGVLYDEYVSLENGRDFPIQEINVVIMSAGLYKMVDLEFVSLYLVEELNNGDPYKGDDLENITVTPEGYIINNSDTSNRFLGYMSIEHDEDKDIYDVDDLFYLLGLEGEFNSETLNKNIKYE